MSRKTKTVGKASKFRVKALGHVGNAPVIGGAGRGTSEKWVRFGRHNLFPEFCSALADNCSPLNACVIAMGQFVAGDGLDLLDANGEPQADAMLAWSDLCGDIGEAELLERTARDVALMDTASWEVINSRIGPAIINHIDVCRVRSGKRDGDGRIPSYWFSSNWERTADARYKPVEIPSWGTMGAPKVLIYRKSYKNLRDYYGEPHWMAAMVDAEVLARIPVFNRTQLDGGFKPSIHAHLTTRRDDADLDKLDEDFEIAFTGENGKPYLLTVGAIDETMSITKLERGDHAGELDATRRVSKDEIYHSYGIPPVLMGVNVNTGLSGKGLAISEELSLFQTTKVRPRQRLIEGMVRKVLSARGISVPTIRIRPLVPFEPATDPALVRMTYLRSTTVNEDRIARKVEPLPDNDERGNMMLIQVTASAPADPDADKNNDHDNG